VSELATTVEVPGFIITIVGVGDIVEDGKPWGRGILISLHGNLSDRRHVFMLQAQEETIRRFAPRVGKEYAARLCFDVFALDGVTAWSSPR